MKSKRRSCDGTLFWGTVVRYAPVWVLYSVGCALLVLLVLGGGRPAVDRAYSVTTLIRGLGAGNMFYALILVQVLFGYLTDPRQCYGIHSMPVTRDRLFRVYALTGLVFFLVPCGVLTVCTAATLGELWYLTGYVVLANVLQFLFFYGAAVFSQFLAGNRIAMVLIFGIISFAGLLAAWFIKRFYEPMLFGITVDVGHVRASSPFFAMTNWRYLKVESTTDPVTYTSVLTGVSTDWGWRGLGLYAAMGVACFPVSQVLYRRRKLESAGDFLAVNRIKWVFLALFTMAAGCAFYVIADNFRGTVAVFFLPIGMIAGYFVGLMLLRRQTNVFRLKVLLPLALMMVTLGLTAAGCLLDVFGIVNRIPKTEDVAEVRLTDYYFYLGDYHTLTTPEDIEAIRAAQSEALETHRGRILRDYQERNGYADYTGDRRVDLELTYELKNGKAMKRSYSFPMESESVQSIRKILSRPENVLGITAEEADGFAERVETCSVQLYTENGSDIIQVEDIPGLVQALLADCAEGTMVQDWSYHEGDEGFYGYLSMELWSQNQPRELEYANLTIRQCNRNLRSWLVSEGYLQEAKAK